MSLGYSPREYMEASVDFLKSYCDNFNKNSGSFFFTGGTGLGKTHLMHSIGHFVLEQNPNKKVLYVTSEAFTNEVIESIRSGNAAAMTKLREKYRTVDVLMIDDVQFIIGKESTQEEFFHTFNVLHAAGKQIIISSDRSPDDLKLLEDRLRTRFGWGLAVDIFPPDLELRAAIIKKKIVGEDINIPIPEEVIEYMAATISGNIRNLEGALTRLVAYSATWGSDITLPLAQEALKDYANKGLISEKNDVAKIQKVVADYFQISIDDLRGKKRSSNISFPRQIAMYLCRKLTDESFPKIGEAFGNRDHTTVMHALKKIEEGIRDFRF